MSVRIICYALAAVFVAAGSVSAKAPSAEQELEDARRAHLTQVKSQLPLLGGLVELQYQCEAPPEQRRRLQAVLSAYEQRLVSSFGVELRQRYRDELVSGAQAKSQRMSAASEDARRAVCQLFLSTIEGELSAMESRLKAQPEILP